jgi:hypothetical protein
MVDRESPVRSWTSGKRRSFIDGLCTGPVEAYDGDAATADVGDASSAVLRPRGELTRI